MTEVEAALADAHRREWARVLAATARVARDLDLAEECVQDAYASALTAWDRSGVPDNPGAWLTTAAKRRAIDAIRRDAALRSRLPLLVVDDGEEPAHPEGRDVEKLSEAVPDERLRLIFVCCHPALAQEAQAALTLRLVCGLPVPDIARAFLVTEPTMAARITRAKKKIATARIPYRVPCPADLPERLRAVLAVIHLLFTAGHTAPTGAALVRADLVEQAMRLARMLCELMPGDAEARGLLALLLVTDARRATRVDADGRLVRLKDQDRSRWDRAALAEADAMIVSSLRAAPPGRYVLQAAIASLYAEAPAYEQTDWPQLVALYDRLLLVWPSPVVALNRAVPLSMVAGPGGRARGGRTAGRRRAAVGIPVPARDQGGPAEPAGPSRGGGRGLPPGVRPGGERGRARVPRRAARELLIDGTRDALRQVGGPAHRLSGDRCRARSGDSARAVPAVRPGHASLAAAVLAVPTACAPSRLLRTAIAATSRG